MTCLPVTDCRGVESGAYREIFLGETCALSCLTKPIGREAVGAGPGQRDLLVDGGANGVIFPLFCSLNSRLVQYRPGVYTRKGS